MTFLARSVFRKTLHMAQALRVIGSFRIAALAAGPRLPLWAVQERQPGDGVFQSSGVFLVVQSSKGGRTRELGGAGIIEGNQGVGFYNMSNRERNWEIDLSGRGLEKNQSMGVKTRNWRTNQ